MAEGPMRILYDSKLEEYKTPFGCLRQDELCTLTIKIPRTCNVTNVLICIDSEDDTYSAKFPMEWISLTDGYDSYQGSFSLQECKLYFYYFTIVTVNSSFNLYKENAHDTSMGYGELWQLTCFDKNYDTPECFKGKVMYQIFPDRFYSVGQNDLTHKIQPYFIHESVDDVPVYYPDHNGIVQNNDFFGGNLQGIIAKLPYLKELGVSVIYLNPIFMAYSNHRYDTADYMRIDPLLGTENDLAELCEKAHEQEIRIILDGVFSHTGCNSVYFDKYNLFGNGAYLNLDSPYRSWYQFNPHNRYEYISWWGIDTLPCTEEMDESFLNFLIRDEDSVIKHWLKLGVDGYRLDVADELPDEFIILLNEEVHKAKKDSIVIGEVWEDASNKISYGIRRRYFAAKELDATMNYPYKDSIIAFIKGELSSDLFANTIMTIAENYPKPVLDCVMNSLSTHDTMRILTVFGTDDYGLSREEKAYRTLNEEQLKRALERLKIASFLQFTLPGTACIYYGDEVGLQGYEDPFNRRYFPWDRMNTDLLTFYQELAKIKNTYSSLQKGGIKMLSDKNGVVCFTRQDETETLYAIVSLRDDYECFSNYEPIMLCNGYQKEHHIVLKKYGFVLLKEPS